MSEVRSLFVIENKLCLLIKKLEAEIQDLKNTFDPYTYEIVKYRFDKQDLILNLQSKYLLKTQETETGTDEHDTYQRITKDFTRIFVKNYMEEFDKIREIVTKENIIKICRQILDFEDVDEFIEAIKSI